MGGRSQGYEGVDDLVDTIDREVAFLCSQPDQRLLIGLPPFIRFLQREPRLSGVVSELEQAANAGLTQFEAARAEVRHSLRPIWSRLKPLVLRARSRQSRTDRLEFDEHDDFAEFERYMESDDYVERDAFQYHGESDYDSRSAFGGGARMQEWTRSAGRIFYKLHGKVPKKIGDINQELAAIEVRATFFYRRHWLDERTLAGHSYGRLKYVARWINPEPREPDADPWEHAGHVFLGRSSKKLTRSVAIWGSCNRSYVPRSSSGARISAS